MAKPAVDGLQQDMQQQMDFTHVNIRDEDGRKLAQRYQVRAVPTFLVIAPDGSLLYRQTGGRPSRAQIEAKLGN